MTSLEREAAEWGDALAVGLSKVVKKVLFHSLSVSHAHCFAQDIAVKSYFSVVCYRRGGVTQTCLHNIRRILNS